MKSKTIAKILAGKHYSWMESIQDEKVKEVVKNNTIITGGSIVSLLLNEEVNDFDVYFRTPEAAFAVAQYYVNKLNENPPSKFKGVSDKTIEVYAKMEPAIPEGREEMRINGPVAGPQDARVRIVVKSAGVAGQTTSDYQYFEGVQDRQEQANLAEDFIDNTVGQEYVEGQVTDETEPDAYVKNVTELDDVSADAVKDDGKKSKNKEKKEKSSKYRVLFVTSNAITLSDKIQIVLRFQGEPEKIHENYDFVHCTSYWSSWDNKLVLNPKALEAILAKELVYQGSKYPICSVIRTRKFLTRGWTINAGQYVKMAYQISKLNLNDPMVLEDQLVGVDSAYFSQLIEDLKKQENPRHVDGGYLMTLIDKIF